MKRLFILFFFICFCFSLYCVPVDKKVYLFKNSDTANSSMANCGVIFLTRDSVESNPALLTQNTTNNIYVGYNHSEFDDGVALDKIKELKSLDYYAVNTPKSGLYFRRTKQKDEGKLLNRKFEFVSNELGLAAAEESSTVKGLVLGLKMKLFFNQISDSTYDNSNLQLITDNGYGYSLDLSFHYKKGPFVCGLSADNLFGNIYWKEYDNIYINPEVTAGIGLESDYIKYGITLNKVFSDGEKIIYGHGVEVVLLNTPEDYPALLNLFKVKLRAGITSEEIFKSKNKKTSYGAELEKNGYFIEFLTEGDSSKIFNGDNKIYKLSIGKQI